MNFNTRTVSRITGLTSRRINYWDSTHFIKPSVSEAAGYGSTRLYSFDDLVQLKVAKTLMDKGISLQKIRKAISYLKKNMKEVKRPLSEFRFLTDGDTIFVIAKDNKTIIDTLKSGQLVISIALGEIVENLESEVVSLQRQKKYDVFAKGKTYKVAVHADEEDGGYWVECPSLPGCASQGETIEEALSMIRDAIQGHLETTKEGKKAKRAS